MNIRFYAPGRKDSEKDDGLLALICMDSAILRGQSPMAFMPPQVAVQFQ